MTLATRRFLYLTFIGAFLIITPLMILYANGYKLSLDRKGLVKTGMFIIATKPEGAKIYIDNELQMDLIDKYLKRGNVITSPARIKNLLPGEYDVKVELDGYWPWQKKLTINPSTSTYAEDIVLFRKNLPLLMLGGEINDFLASPNQKYALIKSADETILLNLETEEAAYKLDFTAKDVAWSPDSKLFSADNRIFSIDQPRAIVELPKIITDLKRFKWGQNGNDLFYQTADGIFSLNLSTQKSEPVLSGEKSKSELFDNKAIVDFFIKDDNLYLISRAKDGLALYVISWQNGEYLRKIELPNSPAIAFTNKADRFLSLYDSKNKTSYLVDPLAYYPLKETINNINKATWIDENRLLYSNDFEIFIMDANSGKKTLLTRLSSAINEVFWHKSNNYVIFTSGHSINSLELDERDKRNTIELFSLDNVGAAKLSSLGDTLYFSGKIGNQRGLYKLTIE